MSEVLLGATVGGCFAGALSWEALRVLLGKRRSPEEPQKLPLASPGSASSPWKFMSPPSHLRRDTPVASQQRVSSDAWISQKKADFDLLSGVGQELDTSAFVSLLRRLISESKHLQNNPRLGIHPEEKRAALIVMQELEAYSTKAGGPLVIEELEYVPGRSNLKITYPGTGSKTLAFVGSHFDVVPADPETWDKDPFQLTEEEGKLYGRGTTDCLGHVALLTCFLKELGKTKPKLQRSIVVLFIAGEEGGEKGVGVDIVLERGKLKEAKQGPVYWVDSADSQPCCGSSGMLSWSLKFSGRLFHSGFPHKAINSIELAMEATSIVQARFYDDFPPHPSEDAYQFATGSHMKPTQIDCAKGSLNQICPETTVSGDIRLSPFYEVEDVVERIEAYVKDLNDEMGSLSTRGSWSPFVLPDSVALQPSELRRGKVELKWNGGMDTFKLYAGIAVSLTSEGHRALVQACRETYASVKPFSVSGSLPLVNMMKKAGFDIQLCGFGLMSVYHGVNEYCTVVDMQKAYEVFLRITCLLESVTE
mmetsp:Transcript_94041/g.261785  ORF Transcript_94041/g.261785 Transcript_94041/m.261785 type:complete len:534 (+) Transcript_94041:61-1662(+)